MLVGDSKVPSEIVEVGQAGLNTTIIKSWNVEFLEVLLWSLLQFTNNICIFIYQIPIDRLQLHLGFPQYISDPEASVNSETL